MSFRKLLAQLIRDEHETHVGRIGELTFYQSEIYEHDGVTPGGVLISVGGGGGGGPVTWASIINKPNFATVATSGSYTDLINKPTIPTDIGDLTDTGGLLGGSVEIGDFIFSGGDASLPIGNTMTLSTYRSGANQESRLTLSPTTESSLYAAGVLKLGTDYGSGYEQYWVFGANGDLTIPGDIKDSSGVSVLFSGDYNDLTNKPVLAAVATSGSYTDLINTPTIPTDVSDLTDTTSLLFSGDYNDLTNKPAIPDSILDLGITDGTNGQVLTTDGAGNFTFTTVAAGALNPRDVTRVYAYVTNADSVTIQKGQPVYMFAATGNRVSVKLAANTGDGTSAKTLGLADQAIAPGNPGYVCTQGVVENLNTGMYAEGDVLYLGATPGSLTNVKPHAPNHLVYIGVVERANNGNGLIYVRPQNGYELEELHNVNLIDNPPNSGDLLTYDGVQQLWVAAARDTSYTPATPSNWSAPAPTTIGEALDRLAALIKTLNSGTGA